MYMHANLNRANLVTAAHHPLQSHTQMHSFVCLQSAHNMLAFCPYTFCLPGRSILACLSDMSKDAFTSIDYQARLHWTVHAPGDGVSNFSNNDLWSCERAAQA